MALVESLERLYQNRFPPEVLSKKQNFWKILCQNFFQKFIPDDSTILDIGAGFGEFINNIQGKKKYALDFNPNSNQFMAPDIEVIISKSTNLSHFKNDSVNVVFASNFLEHLNSKEEILNTLKEIFRILDKNGRLLILQPNIRYLYKEYWDFFDHQTPLSDKSLKEVLEMLGFNIKILIPKFLPYTFKQKLPKNSFLLKTYLKIPILWSIFGKQCFVLAKKP